MHMKPIEDFHQLILDNNNAKHFRDARLYRSMFAPIRREINIIITIFYLVSPLNSITILNRPHL
jgi:hypothetical protein